MYIYIGKTKKGTTTKTGLHEMKAPQVIKQLQKKRLTTFNQSLDQ